MHQLRRVTLSGRRLGSGCLHTGSRRSYLAERMPILGTGWRGDTDFRALYSLPWLICYNLAIIAEFSGRFVNWCYQSARFKHTIPIFFMNQPKSLLLVGASLILLTMSGQSQTPTPTNAPASQLPQFRQPARAVVTVGGKTSTLTPNELGVFPRVLVKPSDSIAIKVSYQGGKTSEGVDVQVEDGGQIVESQSAGYQGELDKNGALSFNLQITSQLGIYRVILRKGGDIKQLEFWAGAAQPQGAPATKIPHFGGQQ